jgi:subtilisin family serine protease
MPPGQAIRKLDRQLHTALEARAHGPRGSARVGAAVVFTGELAALQAVGFEAPSAVYHPVRRVSIAAGSIPLSRLTDLAALDQVISVEGGRAMKPEIDDSVPEIGATIVHQGIGFLPSTKGRGVVIGIIDSGLDFRHGTFRRADGRTRVIRLWDQTLPPGTPGPRPATFDYGIEYRDVDLDAALGELTPGAGSDVVEVRTRDRDGHGTHVAGIAAGNGSQPGNCHFAGHFVGVAPEAELVVVHLVRRFQDNVLDPSPLQHAFEYIFTHPLLLERPVVVNYSQGDNLGPHDGTTALELAIDALVLSRPGHVVVKSVGNEGKSGRHAEVPVPMTGADLRLRVGDADRGPRAIEVWYPGAARLSVQVLAPGGLASQVVAAGATGAPFVANPGVPADERTTVEIRSELGRPHSGDNLITITMASPESSSAFVPSNTWTIRFANTGPGPTTVHAWLDNDDPKTTQFLPPHVSERHTVTTPGTAKHIVTVGAYDDRTSGKVGQLAAFSSRGPVRRVVNPQPTDDPHRPDVVAPGVAITSARPNVDESSCCDCCVDHYTALSNDTGTSVAAPHVAGVVALMLERNPRLPADLVRDILRQTAVPPETGYSNPPTDDDLNTWGRGRVNALAAVQLVVPPIGGGSADADRRPTGARAADSAASGRPCAALAGFTPFRPALAALRRQLLGTSDGRLCAALISRHFSEARGLIRSNRRVAVAWHRVTGPAFVRALVRAFNVAETDVASAPEPPETLARFLGALARYGSAGLRADLDAHGATFVTMLRGALRRTEPLESVA